MRRFIYRARAGVLVAALGLGACDAEPVTSPRGEDESLRPQASHGVPHGVTDLRVESATQTSVTLRWTQETNGFEAASDYALQYGTPTVTFDTRARSRTTSISGTAAGQEMTYTVSGLTAGTSYEFQMMSYTRDRNGRVVMGELSNKAAGSTASQAGELSGVTDLAVVSSTDNSVTLRWTQVSDGTGGAANYGLQHGTPTVRFDLANRSGTTLIAGTAVGQPVTYTVTGLSAGTAYQFQLISYRGTSSSDAVMGPLSNVASGSTSSGGSAQVASVVASPSTYTFTEVGQSTQITATARDGSGNAVSGVSYSWSSTNPLVVSVDGMGVITARSAGSAMIIVSALCCGVSDTVPTTVEDPTDPPPPSSGSALFTDDFDSYSSGTSLAGRGANGFRWGTPLYAHVSGDIAHSGSRSLKFQYGPTEPNGASHWWSEQRFSHPHLKEYWVEYYIYFPNGSEGLGSARYVHNSNGMNNKFFTYWGPGYSDPPAGNASLWGSGENSNVGFINVGGAWSGSNPGPLVASNADRGRWMQIRIHIRIPDYGRSNGLMELWKDGTLLATRRNEPSRVGSEASNYLSEGYLLGYDNARFTQNTWIYIDSFRFYSSNPGW